MSAAKLERRFVPAPGVTLSCWHRPGNGTRWVIWLHGACGNHLMWSEQFDQFPGADLVFLDVRGQGESPMHAGHRASLAGALGDIGLVLDEFGVDRAVLVGHSWGGNPAQEYAYRHPDRVAGLVMVGSWGQHRTWTRRDSVGLAINKLMYSVIPWPVMARYSGRWASTDPQTQAHVAESLLASGRRVFMDLGSSGYAAVHEVADYPARTPTLLIRGDRDVPTVLAAIYADIRAKNPAAREEVMRDVGHQPMMDTAAEFNRLVADFLDELPT